MRCRCRPFGVLGIAGKASLPQFQSTLYGTVYVERKTYRDGGPAVILYARDEELGVVDELTVLSVNLPEYRDMLGPSEFFAKTWSENEEIAEEALASGLFEDTGRRAPTGFVMAQIWRWK